MMPMGKANSLSCSCVHTKIIQINVKIIRCSLIGELLMCDLMKRKIYMEMCHEIMLAGCN